MYLQPLKGALVEALRATFDGQYPDPDFRGLRIGIEYPVHETDYPGLWVQYDDTDELKIAGIGHIEIAENESGQQAPVTRWRFGGTITVTCVAMTSRERDRLYDALVATMAFAKVNEGISEFRRRIENNDFVGINANFDTLRPSGDNSAPGTPWGTEHIIYEKSLSIDVIGEFVSTPEFGQLVSLRKIIAKGFPEGTRDPLFTGEEPEGDQSLPDHSFEVHSPSDWH